MSNLEKLANERYRVFVCGNKKLMIHKALKLAFVGGFVDGLSYGCGDSSRNPGGHRFVNGVCACGQKPTDDPMRCPLKPEPVPDGDSMFSVKQKREISEKVQEILRETKHPELPATEIQFELSVVGAEQWSWARIRNNGAVQNPSVNPWNERQDPSLP